MSTDMTRDFQVRQGTAPLPRNLVVNLQKIGYDLFEVARDIGINPKFITSGLTFAEMDALLTRAWDVYDDPAMCLKVGILIDPKLYNSSGLFALIAPTLAVACERHALYSPLVSGFPMVVSEAEGHAEIRIDSRILESRPYCFAKVDFHITSMLGFMRLSTGRNIQPVFVSLRRNKPAFSALYDEIFQCQINYSQEENVLAIKMEDYRAEQVTFNPNMDAYLERAIHQMMGDLFDGTISGRVRRVISASKTLNGANLGTTAKLMAVSERTLQRRLSEEGVSFASVLDDVRHEAAMRSLALKEINVSGLSYELGFANVNSFYRAFKRWTGMTVAEFRRVEQSK